MNKMKLIKKKDGITSEWSGQVSTLAAHSSVGAIKENK